MNESLTLDGITSAMKSVDAVFTLIGEAEFDSATNHLVLGVLPDEEDGTPDDFNHPSYVYDGAQIISDVFDSEDTGTDPVNGFGNVADTYVRPAWSTGGSAWNINVVQDFAPTSAERIAFDSTFVSGFAEQVERQIAAGKVYAEGTPVLEINVGGPTIGTYQADTFAPGNSTMESDSRSINLNSNSLPTNATPAEIEDIFQTGRKLVTGTEVVWDIENSIVPEGTYIVELLFAEIDSEVESSLTRTFDILLEGTKMLDFYSIWGDRAKIPSFPNAEGELIVAPLSGVIDNNAAGIVKRFQVDVDSNGLQIELAKRTNGVPLLNAIRILQTDSIPPQVTNVTISGSNSTHTPFSFNDPNDDVNDFDGSGIQLRTVPVGGADRVAIKFSEHVTNVAAGASR